MSNQRFQPWRSLFLMLALLHLMPGCAKPPRAMPVDPELAIRSLRQTLDAWKAGASIGELRSSEPEIVAQDMAWIDGQKLLAYEVTGAGQILDANLHVPVTLEILGSTGQLKTQSVVYIVGTDPVITVFREMF